MDMRAVRSGSALAAATVLMLALAGCAGERAPAESSAAQPGSTAEQPPANLGTDGAEASTSEPSEVGEDVAAPLVVPGCDELSPTLSELASEWESEYAGLGMEALEMISEIGTEVFYSHAGPVAATAMESAESIYGCEYGLHWESPVYQWVVELPETSGETLLEGLHGDSAFEESMTGGAALFTYEMPMEEGPNSSIRVTYALIDDVWIVQLFESSVYVAETVAVLKEANPHLA